MRTETTRRAIIPVIALLLLGNWNVSAQSVKNAAGKVHTETLPEERVAGTILTLNVEVPPDWKFWVVSEPEWERLREHFGSPSETAFSIVMMRLTVVRASYTVGAPESRLRLTLAHEFGHAVCWCNSESGANNAAQGILRPRQKNPVKIHFDSTPPR